MPDKSEYAYTNSTVIGHIIPPTGGGSNSLHDSEELGVNLSIWPQPENHP